MGLDMYLTRQIYIGGMYEHNQVKGNIEIETRGIKIPLELKKIQYIDEHAGYWRKANAIHKWFVDNVQEGTDDCKTYDVEIEQLKKLLEICKTIKKEAVLENGIIKNADFISTLLPTQAGFFFGSTEYNEYYLEDIELTIEIIENQLKREKELNDKHISTYLQYHSSW